jgi:apolipoprotein N-acyltransferase
MDRVKAIVGDIEAGKSLSLPEAAGAELGTLICFETTRPDLARRMRRAGASTFVQLSNEAWFGPTSAARQMLATAIFRAVENNTEVVRATNSGLSAQIDHFGIISDETPMFETATRTWRIKTIGEARGDAMTFYTRFGDVFAVACAAASVLLFLAGIAHTAWKRNNRD